MGQLPTTQSDKVKSRQKIVAYRTKSLSTCFIHLEMDDGIELTNEVFRELDDDR